MSEQHNNLLSITMMAAGAVAQHRFVTPSADQAGENELPIGVSITAAGDNTAMPVGVIGIQTVEAGGEITKGAFVKSDAEGKAVAGATDTADNARVNAGIALEAAAEAGEKIAVLLKS